MNHPIPGINDTMQIDKTMNIPGNPTENPIIEKLLAEVNNLNEQIAASIARQKAVNFNERVEQSRLNKILRATLLSIETITKGPEQ
jgi:hypothetical protein